jgi:hypothetical protein
MTVAPQAGNAGALSIEYPRGYTDYTTIQLQLTQISTSINAPSRAVNTPTASGTGPIELIANGNVVALDTDVSVSRSVGRPNDSMTKSLSDLGRYIYKNKVASDNFSLSFQLTDNIQSKLNTITNDIFRTCLILESFDVFQRVLLQSDINGVQDMGKDK